MPSLIHQRCLNHATREAVARCPGCGHYFCRECISEHDERVLCAGCLRKLARVPVLKQKGFARAARVMLCLVGLLAAWIFFFVLGESLLSLPSSFHEGTFWHLKTFGD